MRKCGRAFFARCPFLLIPAAQPAQQHILRTLPDFEDLTVLLADWTGPGPGGSPEAALGTEAVPEPSSLLLALLATLGLSFYRRRLRAF